MLRLAALLILALSLLAPTAGNAQSELRTKRIVRKRTVAVPVDKEKVSAVSSSESEGDDDEVSYRIELDDRESRFQLGIYGQIAQFAFEGRGLMGSAVEAVASYALTHKIAGNFSVSQALDPSTLSILYTGFRVSGAYAFMGNFVERESTLNVGGQTSFISKLGQGPLFAADLGMEQLLFNATGRIVPATGISAGVRYDRQLWKINVSFAARYGQLVIAEKSSTMMSGGVGFLLRF